MICIQNSRAKRLWPRIGRTVTVILASLVLTAGEAMACPYHGFGGAHRFGPFDAAGGWRDIADTPPFETGPTAVQNPPAGQSQPETDIKSSPQEEREPQE